METFYEDFHDDGSEFDDRMELEPAYFTEIGEEDSPLIEEDLYYRPIEEY